MGVHIRRMLAVIGASALLLAGCQGGPELPAASTTPRVPSAEELAAAVLTPGDLPGDWALDSYIEESSTGTPGVLPEQEQQEYGPWLCEKAGLGPRLAADSMRWAVFWQLARDVSDPLWGDQDPTKFSNEQDYSGHWAVVEELLTSGDPAQVAATFRALRDGRRACLGGFTIEAEETGSGSITELDMPDVGEDRYGELSTYEGDSSDIHYQDQGVWTLVRSGSVLMSLSVVDMTGGDLDPLYTEDELTALAVSALTTAASRLP